uniref:Putative ovule protein n=1 Tax=Solanum chacoense TaxID=4108 RepID=A0A0V0GVL2_SOLCH
MGNKTYNRTMFSKAKRFNESTSSLLNHFASHSFEHTFRKLIASIIPWKIENHPLVLNKIIFFCNTKQ